MLVQDVIGSGIIGAGPNFTLQAFDVTVEGVTTSSQSGCAQTNSGGYGLVVLGGQTTIDGFHLAENQSAGLMLVNTIGNWLLPDFAQASPTIYAAHGEVIANGIGLNIQAPVDLDNDFDGVLAYNNDNIDISFEVLPLPSVGAAGSEAASYDPSIPLFDYVQSLGECPEGSRCMAPPYGESEIWYCLPQWDSASDGPVVEPDSCDSCGTCPDGAVCLENPWTADPACIRKCIPDDEEACPYPEVVGDSICNSWVNHEECGFDGGDCCASTCEGNDCGLLFPLIIGLI